MQSQQVDSIFEDLAKDEDTFDDGLPLPKSYYLAEQKAMGLDTTYILYISQDLLGRQLFLALSDFSLKVIDFETVTENFCIKKAHSDTINDVKAHPKDSHLMFTSSKDGCVKLWDVRGQSDMSVMTFLDTSRDNMKGGKGPFKPLTCFDISPEGTLVCAGTEQVVKDSYLLFWDARKPNELVGGYWESHDDSIVSVEFNKEEANTLASGGVDGMVNLYDLKEKTEEDALQTTYQIVGSVDQLHWFSTNGKMTSIACTLNNEGVHVYDSLNDTLERTIEREEICSTIKRSKISTTYVVNVKAIQTPESSLMALAGSSYTANPCLRLLHLKEEDSGLTLIGDLPLKSGSAPIRCFEYNQKADTVIAGSEDGLLRLWKYGEEIKHDSKSSLKESKKKKHAKHNPY